MNPRSQGSYDEAEPLLCRALEISEAALGPDQPNVEKVAANLADVLRQLDREDEAQESPVRGSPTQSVQAVYSQDASLQRGRILVGRGVGIWLWP